MKTIITFVIGFILGCWFGFLITAILVAGRIDDE